MQTAGQWTINGARDNPQGVSGRTCLAPSAIFSGRCPRAARSSARFLLSALFRSLCGVADLTLATPCHTSSISPQADKKLSAFRFAESHLPSVSAALTVAPLCSFTTSTSAAPGSTSSCRGHFTIFLSFSPSPTCTDISHWPLLSLSSCNVKPASSLVVLELSHVHTDTQ